MHRRISATDLAKGLSDVLNRVRYRGEQFIVERNGEPVATIAPARPAVGVTMREAALRLGDLSFPEDGFAEDLEAVQASQAQMEAPPWPN